MPADKGRNFKIYIHTGGSPGSFVAIAGMQSRSLTINNEPVEITNDDTAPQRELLSGAGTKTLSISGSGVFKDDQAINLFEDLANAPAENEEELRVEFENGDWYQGTFHLSSFEYSGEYNGARMFSVTLENAGTWTFGRG